MNEISEQDWQDIAIANEKLSAELAAKENGERVVLLVSGHQYGEVVSKSEIAVTLVFHNRYSEMLTTELEKEGFKAVVAYRVMKANGNRVYLVPTPEGPDVYMMGKYFPAVRKKK